MLYKHNIMSRHDDRAERESKTDTRVVSKSTVCTLNRWFHQQQRIYLLNGSEPLIHRTFRFEAVCVFLPIFSSAACFFSLFSSIRLFCCFVVFVFIAFVSSYFFLTLCYRVRRTHISSIQIALVGFCCSKIERFFLSSILHVVRCGLSVCNANSFELADIEKRFELVLFAYGGV